LRKFRFADELNFDSRFDRHLPGILANPVAEGFGKLPIVEDPDFSLIQKRCHPPGKTDLRQRPENQHPIPTTQHTGYLSGVTFRYQLNAHPRIITTVWFRLCRLRIRERVFNDSFLAAAGAFCPLVSATAESPCFHSHSCWSFVLRCRLRPRF